MVLLVLGSTLVERRDGVRGGMLVCQSYPTYPWLRTTYAKMDTGISESDTGGRGGKPEKVSMVDRNSGQSL